MRHFLITLQSRIAGLLSVAGACLLGSPTLVHAGILGDLNDDACVDLVDYSIFQQNFSEPGCPPPEFEDMVFTQEVVDVATVDIVEATIDGTLFVSKTGVVNGEVVVTFVDASDAIITVVNDDITVSTDGHNLNLLVGNPDITKVEVDGFEVSVFDVIDDFVSDGSAGVLPAAFSPTSRNMLALLALQSTSAWRSNVEVERGTGSRGARRGSPGFWCQVDAAVGAGAMLFVTALGCGALLASCGAATTITFGGIVFLCAPLINACKAGTLGSTAGVYAYIISVWD